MSLPLVSAVVPLFGREARLRPTLQSLRAQSYGGALEVVVVTSGGEVGSDSIPDFPPGALVFVDAEEAGQALTVGCQRARGDILMVLPAGDLACEGRVSRHWEAIARAGAAISTSHPALIDPEDRRVIPACAPAFFPPAGPMSGLQAFERLFYGEDFVCLGATAFTRSLYARVGPFRPDLPQALQQHDFWLRAASVGAPFHVSDDPLSRHRLYALAPAKMEAEHGALRRAMLREAIARLSDEAVAALYRKRIGPLPSGAQRGDLAPFLCVKHPDARVRAEGLQALLDRSALVGGVDRLWALFGLRLDDIPPRLSTIEASPAHQ